MPASISVDGADLRRVGQMLREVPPEMRKELTKALRAPATSIAAEQRAAVRALHTGPGTGGAPLVAVRIAAASVRVDMRLSGAHSGIAIRARRSSSGPRWSWLLNRGYWDHPTFGRAPKHRQTVRAQWFDEAGRQGQRAAATATERQLEQSTNQLARRITAQRLAPWLRP